MHQSDLVTTLTVNSSDCWGAFDYTTHIVVIIISCILGIAWALFNFILVKKVKVSNA